jgi:hypothetical protein
MAFTCASSSTRSNTDETGTLRTDLATDQPRFDWGRGRRQLALSDAATNLFLQSASATAQGVTATAQAHILSFIGMGTMSWTGAASGSPAGTSASQRVALSFTRSTGTLTFAFSGYVRNVQFETGTVATANMPTTGSAVSRSAEVARFSPVIKAILARSAASLVIRGPTAERGSARLVGL